MQSFDLALAAVFRAAAAKSSDKPVDLRAVAEELYNAYYANLARHYAYTLQSNLNPFPRGVVLIPATANLGWSAHSGHILMEKTTPLDIYQGSPPVLHSTVLLTVALLPLHRRATPWPPI